MQRGYITLITILIVSVVGLAIGTSLLLLGVDAARTNLARAQSGAAIDLADACADEALQQIQFSASYTGTVNLTLGDGSCSAVTTDTGGSTRQINATGTIVTVVRKVEVLLDEVNPINVASWQDVADF